MHLINSSQKCAMIIIENCNQFPINKNSSNKNEKLTTKFIKVLCLDCVFGVLALIPLIFLTRKFREKNNRVFLLVLEKNSEKSYNTLNFLFGDKNGQ